MRFSDRIEEIPPAIYTEQHGNNEIKENENGKEISESNSTTVTEEVQDNLRRTNQTKDKPLLTNHATDDSKQDDKVNIQEEEFTKSQKDVELGHSKDPEREFELAKQEWENITKLRQERKMTLNF